jgi:hypothetical protein
MDTNVEILSPAPRDLWQKAISAQSGALLSHTPQWLDTICAVDGWTDASRLYMWPSGQYLVLPMVAKRVGRGLATIEDSFPPGWGFGGVISSRNITPDELAVVLADLSSSRNSFRVHICPNCLQGHLWSQVIPPSSWRAVSRLRNAHVIDLEGGPNAVWKRFSQSAKWSIRKAEKQNLDVECDTTGRLLGIVEELWSLSTQRWAAQSDQPVWLTRMRARRSNPRSRWPQIAKRTRGGVAIWLVRSRGEPAAAVVILRGPNDHYTRGVMRKELAGPTRANALLQWLAIQDACQRGARWYQMGQSGFGSDPVGVFKESFGARAHTFPEFHLERLPITFVTGVARASASHLLSMVRGAIQPFAT